MKYLTKALAFFAVALMLTPSFARAELGYKIDGATVDDVTTTACTTSLNGSVDMFGNGVSMDQVWALEVEVGSRGSNSWAKVAGFTDVFPTANGAAAVGGVTQVAHYVSDARPVSVST